MQTWRHRIKQLLQACGSSKSSIARVKRENVTIEIEYQSPATDAQISDLEEALALRIPVECRRSLLKLFGATFSDNTHRKYGQVSVRNFFSWNSGGNSITQNYRLYKDRIPANSLPIAFAEGGNLLLLSFGTSEIFFWDHELEEFGERSDGSEACVKLADNFEQLLGDLIPSGEPAPTAKVVSVKVDPVFAAKFGLKIPN